MISIAENLFYAYFAEISVLFLRKFIILNKNIG